MQPLAIAAITIGVVMLVGVTVTLILARRRATPGPVGFNPWQRHGSLPLVAAGLALGIIARTGSGQTSATHEIMFAVTTVLLLGALACALAGAVAATGRWPGRNRA